MTILEKPRLTVIIPVYNVISYVSDAIDSVINQSDSTCEVIIVDDGSNDGSETLIEQLYSSIPYVKIIHTENQGLGEARNVGLKEATGDYIYFFDSDDILAPNLVSSFFDVLEKNIDIDLFVFSAVSFYDNKKNMSLDYNSLPSYDRLINGAFHSGKDAFCLLAKKGSFYPNAWIYILRRSVQQSNELFFKSIIHEDEEFTPRLFFSCKRTVVTQDVFFRRRVRVGSIMQTTRSERNIIGYIESINTLTDLISNNSGKCKTLLKARVRSNFIHILNILENKNIDISKEIRDRVFEQEVIKCDKFIFLAKSNLFLFRALRFLLKKVNIYI